MSGALGNGTTGGTYITEPVTVTGIDNATEISGNGDIWNSFSFTYPGQNHNCALLSTGQIKCWGDNFFGQLGDGTNTNSSTPVLVQGVTNATQVKASRQHTCAVLSTGEIKCWGRNYNGMLGDGTTTDSNIPVPVTGISNAVSVEVFDTTGVPGSYYSCAVLSDGTVKCWGRIYLTLTATSGPVNITGFADVKKLALGFYHVCALLNSGQIKCFGRNNYNQLGDGGTTTAPYTAPSTVSGITTATDISINNTWYNSPYVRTCATLADGTMSCWGPSFDGLTGSFTPVAISGISNAVGVTQGFYRTCAILSSGALQCFGTIYTGGEVRLESPGLMLNP
jgi:alpha-tubulin suppressor-like RCC1 family protein